MTNKVLREWFRQLRPSMTPAQLDAAVRRSRRGQRDERRRRKAFMEQLRLDLVRLSSRGQR
jgi:hypothetical protein